MKATSLGHNGSSRAFITVGSIYYMGSAPVTDTRYTNPCDALAIACIRSRGVVGVVSKTSSMPALLAASLISPVSSSGISGTSRPGMQATSVEQCFELLLVQSSYIHTSYVHCKLVMQIPSVCNDRHCDKQCRGCPAEAMRLFFRGAHA